MKDVNDVMKLLESEIENLPHNAVKKYSEVIEKAKQSGMSWKQIVTFFSEKLQIKVKAQDVKNLYFEKHPGEKPVSKPKKQEKDTKSDAKSKAV